MRRGDATPISEYSSSEASRRLSGWLSKIKMHRMVLPPKSTDIGGATMAKIFFRPGPLELRRRKLPTREIRIHLGYLSQLGGKVAPGLRS
jgi:hypothetical protein